MTKEEKKRKLGSVKHVVNSALDGNLDYDLALAQIRKVVDESNYHNDIPLLVEVYAHVRYWEDARVNGVDDDANNPKIPCVDGNLWCPVINAETGQIVNWVKGTVANVHYKVCDECGIKISEDGVVVYSDEDYVPDFLCPLEEGYGDYIILDIDEDGYIKGWKTGEVYRLLNEL